MAARLAVSLGACPARLKRATIQPKPDCPDCAVSNFSMSSLDINERLLHFQQSVGKVPVSPLIRKLKTSTHLDDKRVNQELRTNGRVTVLSSPK
jgi:hypothetical protein